MCCSLEKGILEKELRSLRNSSLYNTNEFSASGYITKA
jgi:hypothetical protein